MGFSAVDFLVRELHSQSTFVSKQLVKKAKELEKQQIINAFNDGYRSGYLEDHKLGSKYYEETFRNETND